MNPQNPSSTATPELLTPAAGAPKPVHWDTIFRNIFSNWASYLVTAVVGFLLAPMVLHRLGNTGYGIWTLVLSLTGYFGLLDLGIRSSVGRFVGRYIALNEEKNVNRTVSTAFLILSAGGTIALLSTVGAVQFFFDAFHVEPQYAAAGKIALVIAGLNMACVLPLGIFSAILIALERYDVLSGVTIIGELGRAALVVACLNNGFGIVGLAVVSLLITTAEYAVMSFFAKALYPGLKLRLRFVDTGMIRSLFGFGIYRFIWIVANQLIFYSDSVVIGVFLGAGSITYFAIAVSLINYGRNVVSMVTDTFAPAAFRMDAQRDLAGLQRLLITGTRLSLLVILPLCFGLIFLGQQFITLWMGKDYSSSALFLTILAIAQFSSMPQYVSVAILTSMAKHRLLAYLALGEGLANLGLSVILIRKLGLVGVAWGTVIPSIICTALIIPLYTLHTLKLDPRDYLFKAFLRPLVCAAPMAGLGYVFYLRTAASWASFAAEAASLCAVFGIMSFFLCLDAGQRESAVRKLRNLRQREAAGHAA